MSVESVIAIAHVLSVNRMQEIDSINSDRYQDYVIKAGQLVGEFDLMYRKFADPWKCVADSTSLDSDVLYALLQHISGDINTALDVGCGLGALTARIRTAVEPAEVNAIDVSQTAIEKAQRLHPGVHFRVHDLLKGSWDCLPHHVDLITMAEVCWYILPEITRVLTGLAGLLRPGGHLVVLQHFYRSEDQQYGNKLMRSPADLINLLEEARFQIEREVHLQPTPPMKVLVWARAP